MKRIIAYGCAGMTLGAVLFVTGCASTYYMVKDPQSDKVYYTEQVETLKGGSVKLMDARSKSTVTIQNSEVKEISSEEYKKGLAAPVTPPAVAVPAAAPAAVPAATPPAAPPAAPAAAPAAPAKAAPTPSPTGGY